MLPVRLDANVPVLMWAKEEDVDSAAIRQLQNIATLPWVEGVRVMPDVHLGKGATVGSVIAMKDAVSPNAVGVDIGCGMLGVRTSLTTADLPDDLGPLRRRIEAAVPVGFAAHDEPVDLTSLRPLEDEDQHSPVLHGEERFWQRFDRLTPQVQDLFGRAMNQMGTLGGGNHFIELCADDEEQVWLQLHSGSRHIGNKLAEVHANVAKELPHNDGIVDRDLAVLLGGTPQMEAYLSDLWWAQEYAARSRSVMMALVADAVRRTLPGHAVQFEEVVNVHHNYVAMEQIDGAELVVTRKGAIRAGDGELGLIPGSMGTGSFVVRGLGNPESYYSAAHGAGRRMSRNRARKAFTLEDLAAQTRGVESRKDRGVLDEIPGAYKDLDEVLAAQKDLVTIEVRLRTLLCVKG